MVAQSNQRVLSSPHHVCEQGCEAPHSQSNRLSASSHVPAGLQKIKQQSQTLHKTGRLEERSSAGERANLNAYPSFSQGDLVSSTVQSACGKNQHSALDTSIDGAAYVSNELKGASCQPTGAYLQDSVLHQDEDIASNNDVKTDQLQQNLEKKPCMPECPEKAKIEVENDLFSKPPLVLGAQDLGRWGERLVARFMEHIDYTVLEKNWRCDYGEVDLVMRNPEGLLVFAEVKTRRKDLCGTPEEAVTEEKVSRYMKMVECYLQDMMEPYSLDVLSVQVLDNDNVRIDHFKDISLLIAE